jgi:thymidylate kinase
MEILGVAGTGKSTLALALAERYGECEVADSLHTRMPAHWPVVVKGMPRVLPILARTAGARPALSWDEVKYLVYVSEWNRYLRTRRRHRSGIVVLDQGPIFALARLLWGRKPATSSVAFETWMTRSLARWCTELDLIVWLDAPDDLLLERINHRERGHEAKSRTPQAARELLQRHRDAYGYLLSEISRLGSPPIHRLDTSASPPTRLVDALSQIFAQMEWLTDRRPVSNVG